MIIDRLFLEEKKAEFITLDNIQVDAPIETIFQKILDGLEKAKLRQVPSAGISDSRIIYTLRHIF